MLLPALRLGVNSDCSYTVRTLRAGAHITNSTGIRSRAFSRICTHGLDDELDHSFQRFHNSSDDEVIDEDDASANARRSDVDGRSDLVLISPNELRLLFLIYISLVVSLMGLVPMSVRFEICMWLMKTMLPPMREENISSDVDGRSDLVLIFPNELRLLFLIYISLVVSLMGLGCKEKRLCNSKLPKRKGHVEDNYHAK
ncbi:hypothetical protein T05_4810 [Trichinella murrelli]|uniref:Uncharacterized protein n=2 Tax=Trichinella TaxID=6333 RepID=A0A0V0T425_9BILA|nr:hypothetical protein T05_4810 [Trichinella murrelli]